MSGTTEQTRKPPTLNPKARLLYIPDLIALGHATSARGIWRMVASGELPKPFKRRNRAVWREATVIDHLELAEAAEAR